MEAQRFFVPSMGHGEQAEQAYRELVRANKAITTIGERISGLDWRHNGMKMSCDVGSLLPEYYQTGQEPVLAILDCGDLFVVCTQCRGGDRGFPVYVGKTDCSQIRYFSVG